MNQRALSKAAAALAAFRATRLSDIGELEQDEVRAAYMEALPQFEQEGIWSEVAGNAGPKLTLCIGDDMSVGQVLAKALNDYLDDLIADAEPEAQQLINTDLRLTHADFEYDMRAAG